MAVGNPYTEVAITGYNVTPPTDDGSQTSDNTVEWAKHKDKLTDPVKTGVDSTQTAITAALDKRLLNSIATKTGSYTVLVTDRGKVLNFTGTSIATFTLLAAATAKVGFELVVRNFGTVVLTIDGNAAETIDGSATVDLYPGQKIFMVCDGTNWLVAADDLRSSVLAKTGAYTVTADDNGRVIDCDVSGGAFTVTLPAAATAKNGFTVAFVKTDSSANAVTIDGDGTETINGQTTALIASQYRLLGIVTDGIEWFIRLGGASSSFDSQLLHIVDEKTQNTVGGTFTLGARRTRDLNTVKTNEISGASLATNQISLLAGDYYAEIDAPARNVDLHKAWLHNVTDTADLLVGTSGVSDSTGGTLASSVVSGRFSLAGTKTLEVQHQCSSTFASTGFGSAGNFDVEIYTVLKIWKVG